jgi:hypothetical protein
MVGMAVRGLLERGEAIAALTGAVESAASGAGSAVLVTGEAGIDKTGLVRAFVEWAADRADVLSGACDDLITPRPLGPLRDAASGAGGPLEAALASGSLEAVFGAAVVELSGSRPTVLLVEDVHWADDATLDVLGYLRTASAPGRGTGDSEQVAARPGQSHLAGAVDRGVHRVVNAQYLPGRPLAVVDRGAQQRPQPAPLGGCRGPGRQQGGDSLVEQLGRPRHVMVHQVRQRRDDRGESDDQI